MSVLSGLEPERVFHYFEEICGIPHGSFHTEQISSYLVSFAEKQGLKYRKDESNNVVIWKPASQGYENAPAVILQGHCDMVCEKAPGSNHDFEKDGLKLVTEGDLIRAQGTTLGGDDGIAVAYAMAVLEDKRLKHPALEVVITSDEEVGLLGAGALDTSDLKGKYFINMDSEEEGKLWISCAGGLSAICEIPVDYQEVSGHQYEIVIDGLLGGHSGAEIDKHRANSSKLMGRFLFELEQKLEFYVSELEGGQKDNAIPRMTRALLTADKDAMAVIEEEAARFQKNLREEYAGTDDGITVKVEEKGQGSVSALTSISQEKVIFYLVQIPFGIQKMSGVIEGLVETSINLGVLKLGEESLRAVSSIRSSVGSAKAALTEKLQYLTEFLGGTCTPEGDYPAWEYKKDSKLRDIMADTFEELFGHRPDIVAIHAGLECGLFYEKIPGLDCVSFGPTMKDIHTTEETLSISSTERMWKLLVRTLENIR
ncbi:MAG: aminoacyl-histidine dipeptidase [Lachnospiraceae bacterium]|jgi:dipeptidase D|nr:aminoacyl-histidine dipeptidase [Lachnospiraceae bacterium]